MLASLLALFALLSFGLAAVLIFALLNVRLLPHKIDGETTISEVTSKTRMIHCLFCFLI